MYIFLVMSYANKILEFYDSLDDQIDLPSGVQLIFPFRDASVKASITQFYSKYYDDSHQRYVIWGINPGRLGAGITGVPFTDPIKLENECGIENDFVKKQELSSVFVYELINNFGGPEKFYGRFYISSVCPLGFIKEGKNYNYYDSRELLDMLADYIRIQIEKQLSFGLSREKAFSFGKGKNYKVLSKLNEKYKWFDELIPLPHPRWVMQYRRREKEKHINQIIDMLSSVEG